jgi:dihydrofolate synthase/folylpolyglutamate synthase
VCALIERALRAAGVMTGLFTSPHLVDFRERIRVGGRWADGERLEQRLAHIQGLAAGTDRTFFEVATALAFDHFAAEEVEWAVVEVGLGGRLDCTNVIAPAVAVITGIALDHTEILGDTLEAVAREKAGIIKRGIPVVTGVEQPEAAGIIAAEACERGAPLVPAWDRVRLGAATLGPSGARLEATAEPWGDLELEIGLRGRHQVENAVAALAALSLLARDVAIPARAVRDGFRSARWPGRLEPCPVEPRLWWDAAHNPDGASRLARAWVEDLRFPPPESVVFGASRDKDAESMLRNLRALAAGSRLIVTRARNERAIPADTLSGIASALEWDATALPDVPTAVRHALSGPGSDRVLLAGSLFAVGEAMEALGDTPGEWL